MATDEIVVWNVSDGDTSDDGEPRLQIVDNCDDDTNKQVIYMLMHAIFYINENMLQLNLYFKRTSSLVSLYFAF
jgi:hypothetical protein